MKYELKKVFALSEMPRELQMHFAYYESSLILEKIVYSNFNLGSKDWVSKNYNNHKKLLNDYLVENGAEINEEVIINLER
jgi:antitoxin component YwqK of YwqJK toxin-antitoxin module